MAKARVAVMLSGTGTTMASLLFASRLPDCPYEIVLVASNKPDARGLQVAAAEGIATFAHSHKGLTREAHEAIMLDALAKANVDYIALCGYMRILTPEFVAGWAGRMLNTHPSLLPKYTGLHTHERALDAGDSHGGCTVHLVTADLDAGPVLGQIPVAILPGDTPEALAQRVLYAEYQLYPRMLADYVGREMDPDWILAKVGELALALPETDARTSHGAPGWRVGGRAAGQDQRAGRDERADRCRAGYLLPPGLLWRLGLDRTQARPAGRGLGSCRRLARQELARGGAQAADEDDGRDGRVLSERVIRAVSSPQRRLGSHSVVAPACTRSQRSLG
jgi:phosphoribosylglycinamide formyltransferase-1